MAMAFDIRGNKAIVPKIAVAVLAIIAIGLLANDAYDKNSSKDEFFLAWHCIALIVSVISLVITGLGQLNDVNPKKIDGAVFLVMGAVYLIAAIFFTISVKDVWNACDLANQLGLSCSSKRGERLIALLFGYVNLIICVVIGLIQLALLKM